MPSGSTFGATAGEARAARRRRDGRDDGRPHRDGRQVHDGHGGRLVGGRRLGQRSERHRLGHVRRRGDARGRTARARVVAVVRTAAGLARASARPRPRGPPRSPPRPRQCAAFVSTRTRAAAANGPSSRCSWPGTRRGGSIGTGGSTSGGSITVISSSSPGSRSAYAATCARYGSSATASERASGNRRSQSRSRHRRTTRSRPSGISGPPLSQRRRDLVRDAVSQPDDRVRRERHRAGRAARRAKRRATTGRRDRPRRALRASAPAPCRAACRRRRGRSSSAELGGVEHPDRLRDPEVEELDARRPVRAAREKQIRWLDVAVHDAGAVRFVEALARLDCVLDGARDGRRPQAGEQRREVLPLEVLHHHVGRARVELADVGDANHVLAAQARRGARLAQKTSDERVVRQGASSRHELQRDRERRAGCGAPRPRRPSRPHPSTRSTRYLPASTCPGDERRRDRERR